MKIIKALLAISIAIIVLYFGFYKQYIVGHTVDNFDGWCSQLLGEDLYRKYNTSAIGYNHSSIREDFVKDYNDTIVAIIADRYLDGASPQEKVVQELVGLKMIGTYRIGNDLYLENQLMIIDKELGIDEFSEWEKFFRQNLTVKLYDQSVDKLQYCIYGTINTHFESFILKGPDNRFVKIPLEFTQKKAFN
jgi:hypothetical protein